ncbi:endonuclease/exonuclease/phosphatase family protein [Streptomyces sp. NPDC001493]
MTGVGAVLLLVAGAVFGGCAVHDEDAVPGPALPPRTLRVLTWNICGEAGGNRGQAGYCPYRDRPEEKIAQIAAMAREREADVITLQEVCGGAAGSHLSLLRAALGPGWSFRHAKGARPNGETRCRDGLPGDLGVAVAVRGDIVRTRSENTLPPDPEGLSEQTLPVLCVKVRGWSQTPCTTHILPGEEARVDGQIAAVRAFVREEDRPTVLTGDFNRNATAPQLEPLSSTSSQCPGKNSTGGETPTFHEWDPAMRAHSYHQLDHVFAERGPGDADRITACDVDRSRMDTTPNEPDSPAPNGYSDHAPVYAEVRPGP